MGPYYVFFNIFSLRYFIMHLLNSVGVYCRIALNLECNWMRIDIYKILSNAIEKHGIHLHLYRPFHVLLVSLKFSSCRFCTFFARFFLDFLWIFVAILNDIVLLLNFLVGIFF